MLLVLAIVLLQRQAGGRWQVAGGSPKVDQADLERMTDCFGQLHIFAPSCKFMPEVVSMQVAHSSNDKSFANILTCSYHYKFQKVFF